MNLMKEEKNVVIDALYELQKNHKPGDKNSRYIQKLMEDLKNENYRH